MTFQSVAARIAFAPVLLVATLIAPARLHAQCSGTVPASPDNPTGVRVNRSGVADSNGQYYRCTNWADTTNPIGDINSGDDFGFFNSANHPIEMADPAIMYLESPHGKWWYITGTFGLNGIKIFKTKDFVQYTVHMNAFENSTNQNLGSKQYVFGDRSVHIGTNDAQVYTELHDLWAPHLYTNPYVADPGNEGDVYLLFSAFEHPRPPKSIANIVRTTPSTQANCTCTAHGFAVNQVVVISGATNITGTPRKIVAIPDANTFTIDNVPAFGTLGPTGTVQSAEREVRSTYQVKIKKCDFLEWHTVPQTNTDKYHFADARGGYDIQTIDPRLGYRQDNGAGPRLFDGGEAQGRPVPCTLSNEKAWMTPTAGVTYVPDPDIGQGGLWRRGSGGSPSFPNTATSNFDFAAMNYDGFVFFDPLRKSTAPWATSLIYGWGIIDPPTVPIASKKAGYHLAAGSLRPAADFFEFDANPSPAEDLSPRPMAFARNSSLAVQANPWNQRVISTNPLVVSNASWDGCYGPTQSAVENGALGIASDFSRLVEQPTAAWAEGSCAFYNPDTHCYYLLYSRNTWDTGTYNIVYRKLRACEGRRFSDLAMAPADWDKTAYHGPDGVANTGDEEKVLLQSDRLGNSNPLARSFGHTSVFSLRGTGVAADVTEFYLIFHAKFDQPMPQNCDPFTACQTPFVPFDPFSNCPVGAPRTVFIKELTFEANGDIKQLSMASSTQETSIEHFVVPIGRTTTPAPMWGCREDFNQDGVLAVSDLFDFLGKWFVSAPKCDWNCSGSVEPSDIFAYLDAWFVGCP